LGRADAVLLGEGPGKHRLCQHRRSRPPCLLSSCLHSFWMVIPKAIHDSLPVGQSMLGREQPCQRDPCRGLGLAQKLAWRAGGMTQVVACLPRKLENLSSNPSIEGRGGRGGLGGGEGEEVVVSMEAERAQRFLMPSLGPGLLRPACLWGCAGLM
jgi:hypothetical protein